MKKHTDSSPTSCFHRVFSHSVKISVLALLISGCSHIDNPATQVIAKVNGDEITIHQLNNALAQAQHSPSENIPKMRRNILDTLVNQQLAVQEAIDQKLDRSPEVMMLINASKREILTRAYFENLVAKLPKPSPEQVKSFYDEHPQLFSQRRIYNLQEITLQNPHPPLAELQQMTAGKSMQDIEAELKKRDVVYVTNSGTRAAEQVALPFLAGLAKLEDGQTSITETPQSVSILHLEASQSAPVPEDAALQQIPQFLMNEKAKVAINDKLIQLKKKSKIEYMNEFANGARTTSSGEAAGAPKPAVQPAAKPGDASSSIERGMSGIK